MDMSKKSNYKLNNKEKVGFAAGLSNKTPVLKLNKVWRSWLEFELQGTKRMYGR